MYANSLLGELLAGNSRAFLIWRFPTRLLPSKRSRSVRPLEVRHNGSGLLQTAELTNLLRVEVSYDNHDDSGGEQCWIAGWNGGMERILVIEHDKALQKVIRRALASEGYEVELVSNGTTGLELVRWRRNALGSDR